MSLLLAPFNNAMRLGMGFNSYTQQLCINDVVQKPGGRKASETDLRPAAVQDTTVTTTGGQPNAQSNNPILSSNSGSAVMLSSDGQMLVSQVVTWEAKFVDKISEVTDSMNIKGSLAIKVDALGGGGEASGFFVDSNKFKESDINYIIQVKVTNQKLVADDVTEFTPVKYVTPAQFTSVYGDSFISGFLEGGVFNALISVKYTDKSKLRKFGGSLAVDLDFKVASVKGSAEGSKETGDSSNDKETTINVSWSGGGDIKPDDVKEWTVDTLLKVAMEFPDRVAKCPQRTSAILTKYTGLRSFYEQNIKGSPLDYENAGVYASALLDAYMDYKSIWKDIQTTTWEVDNHLSRLKGQDSNDSLVRYSQDFQKAYEDQKKQYSERKGDATKNGDSGALEEPIPPLKIQPYAADIFGLDEARRDCRFEMIKIVREVDAVSHDPTVAIDVHRNYQYLSPVIFRRLLPIKSNIKEVEDAATLDDLKKQVQAYIDDRGKSDEREKKLKDKVAEQEKTITDTTTERDNLKKNNETLENRGKDLETRLHDAEKTRDSSSTDLQKIKADLKTAQEELAASKKITVTPAEHGEVIPAGWANTKNKMVETRVTFKYPTQNDPRIIYGLKKLDFEHDQPIRGASDVQSSDKNGFTANTRCFGDGSAWNMIGSWMKLPENDIHMETGILDTYQFERTSKQNVTNKFHFQKRFSKPPVICLWIAEVNFRKGWHSLTLTESNVTPESFFLNIKTWADRDLDGARVGWLAYDAAEHDKRIRCSRISVNHDQKYIKQYGSFANAPFSKTPAAFVGLSHVDAGDNKNLRITADFNSVTANDWAITLGTWASADDHNMYQTEWTVIFME